MKVIKAILLVVVIGLFGFGAWFYFKPEISLKKIAEDGPLKSKTSESLNGNTIVIQKDGEKIQVVWLRVDGPASLSLLANFQEGLEPEESQEKYGCQGLVNGGFYQEDGSPIGLFVSEGIQSSKEISSSTFNGFISLSDEREINISSTAPFGDVIFALQTGPVLMEERNISTLQLKRDEPARRIVAALTEEGDLYFLALYDLDSLFQGPQLTDLPGIILDFSKETGIQFSEAINLDGGTASAFYTEEMTLSPLSPVGSYFCVK